MRAGTVYKRCKACSRAVTGRKCQGCGGERLSWAYRVDLHAKGEARRQVQRSGFATAGEARQAMSDEIARVTSGEPKPTTLTVAAWLDQWLPSVKGRLRGGSWVGYESACRLHLVPRLGRVRLQSLTRAQVRVAYAELEASGLSAKSVHNAHVVLHKALADAMEEGLVTRNAAEGAHRLPRDSRKTLRTWDADQTRAFLAHVKSDRLAAMWRLFATTGMRRGEVLGLRWRDVHLDEGFLSVEQSRVRGLDGWTTGAPKTKSGRRRIDLDPSTVASLRAHRTTQTVLGLDGLVFVGPGGQGLDPDGVSGMFERHAKAAGLPRIRLHDLRHGAASLMLAAGANLKVIQEMLGHSSITVTMDVYGHLAPTLQREAVNRLAATLDG